jgi:hypothetical protein
VTTTLDLEAGLMPIERAYAEAAAVGRPLNYGFSASWGAARARVLLGIEADASLESGLAVLGDPQWQRSSSPRELAAWLDLLGGEIANGALGIGVLMGYAPRHARAVVRAPGRRRAGPPGAHRHRSARPRHRTRHDRRGASDRGHVLRRKVRR